MKIKLTLVLCFVLVCMCSCKTTDFDVAFELKSENTLLTVPFLTIGMSPGAYNTNNVSYVVILENIENGNKQQLAINTAYSDYLFITDLPEGEYHITGYNTLTGLVGGKERSLDCEKNIVVKRGVPTISPYKFTIAIQRQKPSSARCWYYFYVTEIKEKEQLKIKEYLASHSSYIKKVKHLNSIE